eukprot:CAMPEP_0197081360 /NCGR_PEP_ID=MMETSP1384-20130603/214599_1 /TAXON_ID=29189 /ORGANISM="Ammonia sp." /LENGTH=263 /DNA_ID=CAMNT_0042520255 /DNA_START=44 /DNA_END=832 /DNA_ORIENTATION=-
MPASDGAKDLMTKLIESDTSKRLSAKEALQHPWIVHEGKTAKEVRKDEKRKQASLLDDLKLDDSVISKSVGYQLANFSSGNQFKHAVAALFRNKYQKMRPQHFENLKKLFQKLDTNGSGTIDYEEFKGGMINSKDLNMDEADIKKMFEELDVAKVGEIDFEALVNAAVHDYLIANDQRLYEAFRDLDDDEDGKIQTSQLKEKLKQMDMYGKADELIKIIDSVDLDKDGTIDYEEFLRAVHPEFNETPKWFWGEENKIDEQYEL